MICKHKVYSGAAIIIVIAALVLGIWYYRDCRRTADFPEEYPAEALEELSETEIEKKVEAVLSSMTEEELYSMLGGVSSAYSAYGFGTGYVAGVPRLGVPVLRCWDGPRGVVGDGQYATTCPASEVALGCSFDEDLAYAYGELTAEDNKACGGNVQLGAQLDLIRAPFFGRSRDSLSEDPLVVSRLGYQLARGISDHHVICVLKHFCCFCSKFSYTDNIQVDEQTLHQMYLAPFRYILERDGAAAVMTSQNANNGAETSANSYLLKTVLRDMWDFRGMVMSDWSSNLELTTQKGMDLEMSCITYNSQENIEAAIARGEMSHEDVVTAVRHTLYAMGKAGYLGLVQVRADGTAAEDEDPPRSIEMPYTEGADRKKLQEDNQKIALETAEEGAVLLKNEQAALPLEEDQDIVLIGPLAEHTMNYRMESSFGNLAMMKGPREELERLWNREVEAETGLDLIGEAVPAGQLYTDAACTVSGVNCTENGDSYYTKEDFTLSCGTFSEESAGSYRNQADGNALSKGSRIYMTAYLKAEKTGTYEFQLLKIGGKASATIAESGKLSSLEISGSGSSPEWPSTNIICTDNGLDIPAASTSVELEAGKTYLITITAYAENAYKDLQLSLNWFPPDSREDTYQQALNAAATHETVVFFAGDTGKGEGEHVEKLTRKTLELPADQLQLLKDVLKTAHQHGNKVIVVLETALPVTMDWAEDAEAILEMWLPGQAGGTAIAELLSGEVNPSGKLTVTFPASIDDTPYGLYPENSGGLRVNLMDPALGGEGIFIGYRWYEKEQIQPLYCFGYGLSYTTFSYSDLTTGEDEEGCFVAFTVTNTGSRKGTEIAQVYVGAPEGDTSAQMEEKTLAGFARVEDLKPGESRQITLHLDEETLEYWDTDSKADATGEKWVLPEGERKIYVGSSVEELPLQGTIICSK